MINYLNGVISIFLMIVQLMGLIDVSTAVFLFLFLRTNSFQGILVFFLILLALKAILTLKDLFSIIDLVSSLAIVFALFGFINDFLWFVVGWLFLKGLFSLVSSV
jgi:hypothetical protein